MGCRTSENFTLKVTQLFLYLFGNYKHKNWNEIAQNGYPQSEVCMGD